MIINLNPWMLHCFYEGLDLGFIYHSQAVQSESNQTLSILPDTYIPTTLPGSRAPYIKLIKNKKEISILDLFEKEYILLIGIDGEEWQVAAKQLAETLSFPLIVYKVASSCDLTDPENNWHKVYEISTKGAVLVRPDGHVAWRSTSIVEDTRKILENCLKVL